MMSVAAYSFTIPAKTKLLRKLKIGKLVWECELSVFKSTMKIQNIRYFSNADNFIMAHGYETIHIRPPVRDHRHLSICLTEAPRSKETEITEFHTADWTYNWFWYYDLEVMDQPPYIPSFTPSDCHLFRLCMKYLAGKRFAVCWHETSCNLLGPDTCHRFLLGQYTSLVDMVGQTLKCLWWLYGGLVGAICYPSAMYTWSQYDVLGIRMFCYFFETPFELGIEKLLHTIIIHLSLCNSS
jgi:hypothetical protein